MHNRHNKNSKNSKHVLSLVDSRELFLNVVLVVGMVVIVAQIVGGGGIFYVSSWDLSYLTFGSYVIVILLVVVI